MSNYKTILKDINSLNKNIKIIIISSEFNKEFTSRLEKLNEDFLVEKGFTNIEKYNLPGAFEIPALIKKVIDKKNPDLILTLGVVVRGETTHYDYVAGDTARAIMDLSVNYNNPIIFGLLTCENFEQVEARMYPSASVSGLNLLYELEKLK